MIHRQSKTTTPDDKRQTDREIVNANNIYKSARHGVHPCVLVLSRKGKHCRDRQFFHMYYWLFLGVLEMCGPDDIIPYDYLMIKQCKYSVARKTKQNDWCNGKHKQLQMKLPTVEGGSVVCRALKMAQIFLIVWLFQRQDKKKKKREKTPSIFLDSLSSFSRKEKSMNWRLSVALRNVLLNDHMRSNVWIFVCVCVRVFGYVCVCVCSITGSFDTGVLLCVLRQWASQSTSQPASQPARRIHVCDANCLFDGY